VCYIETTSLLLSTIPAGNASAKPDPRLPGRQIRSNARRFLLHFPDLGNKRGICPETSVVSRKMDVSHIWFWCDPGTPSVKTRNKELYNRAVSQPKQRNIAPNGAGLVT
jgi:hypothetical protein